MIASRDADIPDGGEWAEQINKWRRQADNETGLKQHGRRNHVEHGDGDVTARTIPDNERGRLEGYADEPGLCARLRFPMS